MSFNTGVVEFDRGNVAEKVKEATDKVRATDESFGRPALHSHQLAAIEKGAEAFAAAAPEGVSAFALESNGHSNETDGAGYLNLTLRALPPAPPAPVEGTAAE